MVEQVLFKLLSRIKSSFRNFGLSPIEINFLGFFGFFRVPYSFPEFLRIPFVSFRLLKSSKGSLGVPQC